MPSYALLVRPAANRVFGGDARRLLRSELLAVDRLRGGSLDAVEALDLAGVPYLAIEGRPDVSAVAALSSAFALFERERLEDGDVLRPVELPRVERYDGDLVTIQRYVGKTNETLTRLLVNLGLAAAGVTTGKVLDPLCGRGTTLNQALLLGCDAFGIDVDAKDIAGYSTFLTTWLQDKRIKHQTDRSAGRHRFRLTIGRKGEPQQVVDVATGDTTEAPALFGRNHVDAVVTDLPYGVQHGATGAARLSRRPDELLAAALPVWRGGPAPRRWRRPVVERAPASEARRPCRAQRRRLRAARTRRRRRLLPPRRPGHHPRRRRRAPARLIAAMRRPVAAIASRSDVGASTSTPSPSARSWPAATASASTARSTSTQPSASGGPAAASASRGGGRVDEPRQRPRPPPGDSRSRTRSRRIDRSKAADDAAQCDGEVEVVRSGEALVEHDRGRDPRHPVGAGPRPGGGRRGTRCPPLSTRPSGIDPTGDRSVPAPPVAEVDAALGPHRVGHGGEVRQVLLVVEPAGRVEQEPLPHPRRRGPAARAAASPAPWPGRRPAPCPRPSSPTAPGAPARNSAPASSAVSPSRRDRHPSSRRIPPPGPVSVHNGTPAACSAATSR